MKKFALSLLVILISATAWLGFVREPLPPIPEITGTLSPTVKMNFNINSMNSTGIELSMKEKVAGKGMFLNFQMANTWKTGRTGLVLKGIKVDKGFNIGMPPSAYLKDQKRKAKKEKDFSDFMKDRSGKSISNYSFTQAIVEGKGGKKFMKIAYSGATMEMLETLTVANSINLPKHIAQKFGVKGMIQFKPGTVAFDKKIQGFYIPVVVK